MTEYKVRLSWPGRTLDQGDLLLFKLLPDKRLFSLLIATLTPHPIAQIDKYRNYLSGRAVISCGEKGPVSMSVHCVRLLLHYWTWHTSRYFL